MEEGTRRHRDASTETADRSTGGEVHAAKCQRHREQGQVRPRPGNVGCLVPSTAYSPG